MKGLIETAHSILAGLDPADDMAFALAHDKLWSVHLNDQNGLKYDQDKDFGSADLRGAFNQVRVLEERLRPRRRVHRPRREGHAHAEGKWGDRPPDRQPTDLPASRGQGALLDRKLEQQFIDARDYEALELAIMKHLMGVK